MTAAEFNKYQIRKGFLTVEHLAALAAFAPAAPDLEAQVKAWQVAHDLDDDGKAGTDTQGSLTAAARPLPPPPVVPFFWDGPAVKQPRNRAEIMDLLGDPTGGGRYRTEEKPDPAWVKANVVECHGATALHPVSFKKYQKVHKIVEPYLREALRRAEAAAPGAIKVLSGPLVFRHQRHDPKRPLSNHSWGCAIDINPSDNGGTYHKRGQAPKLGSPEWAKLYPRGLPMSVVLAFASCGFAWGGDWDEDGDSSDETYLDPMHFEWVARDGKHTQV